MNKTIIININGIVFHIEEDAYEELRAYMIEVKKHFAYTADSKEIVGDIENRIAEMFSERIMAGKKEVITSQDVAEICAQMGKVSDFEREDGQTYTEASAYGSSAFSGTRKLFRDADNKMLGGVCSGLAYYLDVETVWVRLAMVLLFVFAGTGFLLYIILWIVLPVARTRADRMAMRGEAPNLQNFKKNFEEEMEGLRGNFTKAGESIKPGLNRIGDGVEHLVAFVGKLFVLFIKGIGILILFSFCAGLLGTLFSLLTLAFWGDGIFGFGSDGITMFVEREYLGGGLIAAFLLVAIPLVALIALFIKILFDRRLFGNYMAFALLLIWFTAAGFVTFYSVKTAEDFTEDATVVREHDLLSSAEYHIHIRDINTIKMTDDSTVGENPTLFAKRRANFKSNQRVQIELLKAAANERPKIIQEFRASGRDFDMATQRAARIHYQFNQDSSDLFFDSHSIVPKGELMRDQRVFIKLFIPIGTKIGISEEADRYLWNIPTWQCRENLPEHEHNNDTFWMMTEAGPKCLSEMREEGIPLKTDTLKQ